MERYSLLTFAVFMGVGACGPGEPDQFDPKCVGDSVERGEPIPLTAECSVRVVTHQQSGAECPIVNDLLLHCEDGDFGDPGLRVAPAADADALYVATSGADFAWFGALTPDGGGEFLALPTGFTREVLSLAQAPDGRPYVAAYQATPLSNDGGAVLYDPSGGVEDPVIASGIKGLSILDTEFDTQGRAHLFCITESPSDLQEFIREPGGAGWSAGPVMNGWSRYGLTSADESFALEYLSVSDVGYRMHVDEGEGAYPISDVVALDYSGLLAVPPALPELETAGPRFLAFSQTDSGLHVAPSTEGGYSEVTVPLDPLELTCLRDYDGLPGSCPAECDELADGLWDEQVAAARTSDGRVWAAYALTHIDQTRVYEESCNDEVGCWCNSTTTRDDSWGELVLLELDMSAGEAVEVMRVKTLDVELHSLFILTRESVRAFDMRAFGTSLALGVRVRAPGDEEFQTPDMRLLRIDTAQIEPAFGR